MKKEKNIFEKLIGSSHNFNKSNESPSPSNQDVKKEDIPKPVEGSILEPIKGGEVNGFSENINEEEPILNNSFESEEPVETIDLNNSTGNSKGSKTSYEEKQSQMAAKMYVKSFDIFSASICAAISGSSSNRPFKMSKEDFEDYLEITEEAFIEMGVKINPAYFFVIATGTAIAVKYSAYSEFKNKKERRAPKRNNKSKEGSYDIDEASIDFSETPEFISKRRYYSIDRNGLYEYHGTDSPKRRLKISERSETPSIEVLELINSGMSSIQIRKTVLNE